MSDRSIGSLAGGVLGAAVLGFASGGTLTAAGFAIGSRIGGSLLADDPDAIKGPRLDDTSVQSDDLGTPLGWVYGTQRVTAFRSWVENNQLREEIITSGGGGSKGGPSKPERETAKYYVSFLAVLAEVPEGTTYKVRRVWADSIKLVDSRGQDNRSDAEFLEAVLASSPVAQGASAGNLTSVSSASDTVGQIVFLDGNENQKPPSRIVGDRGKAPGYRGVASLYFEDLALERFGNRVPKISAEIVNTATGDTFDVVYEQDSTNIPLSLNNDLLWIDGGIINTNQNLDGDLGSGNHIAGKDRKYADMAYSLTGDAIIEKITKDYLTIGGSDDDIQSNEFQMGLILANPVVSYLSGIEVQKVEVGFYTNRSGSQQAPIVDPFISDSTDKSELKDRIEQVLSEIPSGSDIASRCIIQTPDRQNVIRIANHTDGSKTFSRHQMPSFSESATNVSFDQTEVERGELKFDGAVSPIRPNRFASGDARAAIESGLNRLWVRDSETSPDTIILLERDFDGDYQEVLRQQGTNFDADSMIADNGVLRAIGPNEDLKYISFGLVDPEKTTLSEIVSDLCERAGLDPSEFDASQLTQQVRGYVARNTTARSAIKQLRQLFPFDIRDSGYKIEFVPRGGSEVMTLTDEDLQAREPGSEIPPTVEITREPETDLPRESELTYNDVDRRLEQNLQREQRQSTRTEGKASIQAPIAMNATEARQAVDVLLKDAWASQVSYSAVGSVQLLELEPADVVTLDTTPVKGRARVTRIDDGDPGIRQLELAPEGPAQYSSAAESDSGKVGNDGATLKGPTRAILLDLPPLSSQLVQPGFAYGLRALLDSWPGGSLVRYTDGSQGVIASRTESAIVGNTATVLGDGPHTVFDRGNTLDVNLQIGALSSVTEQEVLAGANAIAIEVAGEHEIVQFADATQIDSTTWRISTLLRGRGGTEFLTDQHTEAGKRVTLLNGAIDFQSRDSTTVGESRGYAGVTNGELPPESAQTQFTYNGINLLPLAPVQIRGERDGNDDLTIKWRRRTRTPADYIGNQKAPLDESNEEYEVDILDSQGNVVRTLTTNSPSVTYTASEQTNDFGSTQSSVDVEVYQLSDVVGRGRPGTETV